MNREDQYKEFLKEYEKLCDKYEMEFSLCAVWGDDYHSIQVYDRKENVFHIEW